MLRFLRFSITLVLLVWLGATITITFYVAVSLFNNESGLTPDSTAAADVIAPILRRLDRTGWIAIPAAILLHFPLWSMVRRRGAVVVSILLLAVALGAATINGVYLSPEMRHIRTELKREFGGYHLAPSDNAQRRRFSRLHGLSMMLVMVNLGLGLGSFFCATQLFDPAGKD